MKRLTFIAMIFLFAACSDTADKNNSKSDAGNDSGQTTTAFQECQEGFYEVVSSVDSDDPENPGGTSRSCKQIPSSCQPQATNNTTNNATTGTNNGTTNGSTNNAQNNLQDGTTQYCRCLIDNTPGTRDFCECDGDKNIVTCKTSG